MATRSLRVLLLSPVSGLDPDNGDVTYTEQLLSHPGPGVEYVRYPDALRDGSLVEHHRRRPDDSLVGALRRGGASLVREAAINRARQRGLLFREPFRHFSVRPGCFDVVHSHVFSLRLRGRPQIPLVVSNSISVDALYRDGFGVTAERAQSLRRRDVRLAAATGVTHSSYGHVGATAVVCFSEHLRKVFLADRPAQPDRYVVVPPGIDPGRPPAAQAVDGHSFHLGFIGHWHAKGGDLVLAAYRRLVEGGIPARLTVVGGPPQLGAEESARLGIRWLPRLPRRELLEELVPSLTAFAYPSRFDGLPLTLLEVMARGVPVVVSDYGALPEVVEEGRSGIVVRGDDVDDLTRALRSLLDAPTRTQLAEAGRQRVVATYSVERVAEALSTVYDSARI